MLKNNPNRFGQIFILPFIAYEPRMKDYNVFKVVKNQNDFLSKYSVGIFFSVLRGKTNSERISALQSKHKHT